MGKAGAFRAPETSERGAGSRTREQSDRENDPDPNERAEGARNASADKKMWRGQSPRQPMCQSRDHRGAVRPQGAAKREEGAGDPRPRSMGR